MIVNDLELVFLLSSLPLCHYYHIYDSSKCKILLDQFFHFCWHRPRRSFFSILCSEVFDLNLNKSVNDSRSRHPESKYQGREDDKKWKTNLPRDFMTSFNSLISIVPSPFSSNISKAILNFAFSSFENLIENL